MRLGDRFFRERWNIGILPYSVQTIARRGLLGPVQWLPAPGRWEFLADPACYPLADGRLVLLAERLNYWNERGEIWAAVIAADKPMEAVFRPWLCTNFHLSYPFPFYDGDVLHMMCESWEAGGLFLWRKTPQGWQMHGQIIDRPTIDATIWHGDDRWWLFCGLAHDHPSERLHIFFADRPEGPWQPHPGNPVKTSPRSSRPAGPLFWWGDMLIRPAQDCSSVYGGAITLNVVERCDVHRYSEFDLRQLTPDSHYPDGIHTICAAGDMTIVDGKRMEVHPVDLARKLVVPFTKRLRRWHAPQWPATLPELP